MTEIREFQPDFETPLHAVDGASTSRRPDAISLDYRVAFTFGPKQQADPSEGVIQRAWYVRDEEGVVWISRANNENSDWEDEIPLFAYEGPEFSELDVAFEQNGRAVVVGERPTGVDGVPEIWLRWFDPQVSLHVFEMIAPGRTPRIVLDSPNDTENSDVHVFYIHTVDQKIYSRIQRERYENDYEVGISVQVDEDTYIEEIGRTSDYRLLLVISKRNQAQGRYNLENIYSTLLPVIAETGTFHIGAQTQSLTLDVLITVLDPLQVEWHITALVLGLALVEPLIEIFIENEMFISASVLDIDLVESLIEREKEDEFHIATTVLGLQLDQIVIVTELLDNLHIGATVLDLTLEVA